MSGNFDFNKTPLAPLGTKAIVYEDPENRSSWSPNDDIVWYVGPARGNYRCYKLYCLHTKRVRIVKTADFPPTHDIVPGPGTTPAKDVVTAATDLTDTLIHLKQNRIL